MSTTYKPPMKEIEFLLNDVLHAQERTKDIAAFASVDWDMAKMMLETVSDYSLKVALPLNASADKEGCTFDAKTGSVTTPKGFKEAFDEYRGLGLIGLHGSEQFGGINQPHYLGNAMKEILTACNFSLATYAGLTAGAAKVLEVYASDEIKAKYLPKMYAGEWTGTMCLTEPNAGSDLGGVLTKAIPQKDGTFAITGNKIFITCGEHGMSENICHLVLARLPGAPEGTKGISLFLVPKLNDDGSKNGVACTGIEEKMGIHGSATAALSFDGAKGVMVGKENEGLKAMFAMMNDARLNVALQGLSLSDIAFQSALDYAKLRVQGKKMNEAFNDNAKPVAIVEHANISKELLEMKAQIDGFRALAYDASIALDLAENHPDAQKRAENDAYVALLTPVLKSGLTDLSCTTAQKGAQIHGGMGFIRETGVEQFYRDALIGTIYEGTNDIQAMDFTFRKALKPQKKAKPEGAAKKPASDKPKKSPIPTTGLAGIFFRTALGRHMIERKFEKMLSPTAPGTALSAFGLPMQAEIEAAKGNPALAGYAKMLEGALDTFSKATVKIGMQAVTGKVDAALINARDYTEMFSKVAVGRMWLKMMTAVQGNKDADLVAQKMQLGEIYMTRVMQPSIASLNMRLNTALKGEAKNLSL